ncbi:hypothetical protein IQ07DRAFT_362427 [Pyrenochaeta sp. DS3sAY3a]|nr:hypothetical protein IQ07DRAFT_362427 [Pyrenochaeta sp. DS3sAY3a]
MASDSEPHSDAAPDFGVPASEQYAGITTVIPHTRPPPPQPFFADDVFNFQGRFHRAQRDMADQNATMKGQKEMINELRTNNSNLLEANKVQQADFLQGLKSHEDSLKSLGTKIEHQDTTLSRGLQGFLDAKEQYSNRLRELNQAHEAELERLERRHEKEREEAEAKYQGALREKFAAELAQDKAAQESRYTIDDLNCELTRVRQRLQDTKKQSENDL